MAKIMNVLQVIRNNWKKTVFGSGVVVYGVNYGIEQIEIHNLMRRYCEDALTFGEQCIPVGVRPRHVTVILNPAANKRKAKTQFEKYCAPLLHLAGISVDILVTESAGQACTLVDSIDCTKTDAIVVAGGDGTLLEVVTGLMRRKEENVNREKCDIAVGILPLGRTNVLARRLFGCQPNENITTYHMAEASMAVVRGQTKRLHTLRIEVMDEAEEVINEDSSNSTEVVDSNIVIVDESDNITQKDTIMNSETSESNSEDFESTVDNSEADTENVSTTTISNTLDNAGTTVTVTKQSESRKPVYSLSGLEWGVFRDTHSKRDKYWYFGSLRSYAAYLFNSPSEPYRSKIIFTAPCEGCSRCYAERKDLQKDVVPAAQWRWWHMFVPRVSQKSISSEEKEEVIDYSSVYNHACGSYTEIELNTMDFSLTSANIDPNTSALSLNIGPEMVSWFDYIGEGWRRERGEERRGEEKERLQAQQVEIKPFLENQERWLSIDNEDYEMRPIRVTLLHNSLRMFYSKEVEEKRKEEQNARTILLAAKSVLAPAQDRDRSSSMELDSEANPSKAGAVTEENNDEE